MRQRNSFCERLDRRRNRAVQTLDRSLSKGTLRLGLVGQDDMSVELFGAKDKNDLFLAALDLQLVIEVPTGPHRPENPT